MGQVLEFGVSRFASMVEEVIHTQGKHEVDKRTEHLPAPFREELIQELKRRSRERYSGS